MHIAIYNIQVSVPSYNSTHVHCIHPAHKDQATSYTDGSHKITADSTQLLRLTEHHWMLCAMACLILVSIYSLSHLFPYTECNWKVWANFRLELHILKQEKMSISCVSKHLICVIADFLAQENFCWWFVQWCAVHFFISSVLFRYETRFGRWHHHGVIHSRHQQQFIINVWIGGDSFVGQHICHIGLQATTIKVSSYIIQNYWKMYHWQSTNVVDVWWFSITF
jgi:hypothetical protein